MLKPSRRAFFGLRGQQRREMREPCSISDFSRCMESDAFVFGFYGAMPMLAGFRDHQLCCQFDREEWGDIQGPGLPPVGYDLGGASGGPMLAQGFSDGAWGWRLVGVISEARSIEGFERVTAVRSHFIQPDGRLRLW